MAIFDLPDPDARPTREEFEAFRRIARRRHRAVVSAIVTLVCWLIALTIVTNLRMEGGEAVPLIVAVIGSVVTLSLHGSPRCPRCGERFYRRDPLVVQFDPLLNWRDRLPLPRRRRNCNTKLDWAEEEVLW